ncbi:glycosyltransferase family 2 protein [Lapidilactobacillus wuchangensis]|uniref:glycosyltransferase family 2 protein n=1 Tax=Lapidilactobacillus wuchangensis TaxID=2486001 RepID=UPI0013DE48F3|nr:glycosyltransferase family 2 protein [Lapidilactobacillus wuchangensis]
MKLVSIIIPVYNGEYTIKRAIESCQGQTYTNLEILVINNASTDHTAIIVNDIVKMDKRVKLIEFPEKGRSKARNVGLDNAHGEYIQFLDADDTLTKNKVIDAVNYLNNHPNKMACGTNIRYIKDSKSWDMIPNLRYNTELLAHNIFPINTFVFEKNTVRFVDSLEYDEDWMFWVDLFQNRKKLFTILDDIGGYVYVTGVNTMSNTSKMLYYEIFVRGVIKQKYRVYDGHLLISDLKKMIMLNVLYQQNKISDKQLSNAKKNFKVLNKVSLLILKLPTLKKRMTQQVNRILDNTNFQ